MSDRDSAIIKIGFEADVKDFVKNIKKELASVKDFGVGDALKEEINDIEAMLDGLSKSFSDAMGSKLDSKTFASFEKKINAEVQAIDKRVTNLEDSMQALVTTMDSADSSKMTSFLQDVGSKMQLLNGFTDETVKAIRELVNIVSKSGGSVKFADNSSIESLEKEKKILQEISDGLIQVKTSGLLKSETGALRQISNAYDNLREARKKLSEVKDVGNNLEIAQAEKDVVQLTQTIREFQEQSKGRNYKKHPFTEELIKELVEAEGEVKVITSKIEDRLLQIGKSAKNLGKSSAASMSKEQSEIKIPIIPDITKEDFWPKVRGIIEYTQKSVDKNPVEIGFVLSSKMSTKNTNKLLKEWQEKVATIDDDQLRGEFESLYDQLAKDVNKGIHINVDSNLKKESDNIRDGVSELQKMLGNKVKVYPQFTISERQTKKLQTELNKASKSLTLTINNFELKEKGKNELSKNIEEVSTLRDVVDNLNSKLEKMGDTPLSSIYDSLTKIFDIVTRLETPIHEIANSIKYLGTGLRAVTDFTPDVDLDGMFSSMADSISTIHGKLGKVKGGENPLVTQLKQIVVAYKEYQKLGGEKSLANLGGDANVQNWLKKHENDDFSGVVSNIVEQYIGEIQESIPKVKHAAEELAETPKEVVEQEQSETSRVAEALAEKFGDTLSDAFLNQKDKVKKALKSLLLDNSLSLIDLSSDKSMFSALSDEVYREWVEAINAKAKLESKGKLKAKILSPEEEEERKGRWAESLSEVGLNSYSKYARLDFKELKNLTDISKMKSYYQQLTELVSKLNVQIKSDRGSADLKEFVSKINDVITYFDNQIKETEKANSTIRKRTKGKSNYKRLTAKDLEEDSALSAGTWEAYRHLKKQDKKDLFLQIASMFKEYQNNSDEEVLKAIKQLVDESDFSKSLKAKFNDELTKATKNQKDNIAKASDELVSEYAEGMESAKPEAKKAGENIGEAAIEGVQEVTDTHSPSKVAEKLGEYFGEGYANGILKGRAKVKNAIRALFEESLVTLDDIKNDTDNGRFSVDAFTEIQNGKKPTKQSKDYQKQIQKAEQEVQTFLGTLEMFKGSKAYNGIDNIEQRIVEMTDAIKLGVLDAQKALEKLFDFSNQGKGSISTLEKELSSLGLGNKTLNLEKLLGAENPEQLIKYYEKLLNYNNSLWNHINAGNGSKELKEYADHVGIALTELEDKLESKGYINTVEQGWINLVDEVVDHATSKIATLEDELKSFKISESTLNLNELLSIEDPQRLIKLYDKLVEHRDKIFDASLNNPDTVSTAFMNYGAEVDQAVESIYDKIEKAGYSRVEGQWVKTIDKINAGLDETAEKVKKVTDNSSTDKLGKFLEKAGLDSNTVNLDKMLQTDKLDQQKKYYELLLGYNEKLNQYISSRKRIPKEAREYEGQISNTLNELQAKIESKGYKYGESGWVKIIDDIAVESANAEVKVESLNDELKRLGLGETDVNLDKILKTDAPETLIGYYRGLSDYYGKLMNKINQGEGSDNFLSYADRVSSTMDEIKQKLSMQGWELHGNVWENIFENAVVESSKVNDNLNDTIRVLNTSSKEADKFADSISKANDSYGWFTDSRISNIAQKGAFSSGLKEAIKNKTYNGQKSFELPKPQSMSQLWDEFISDSGKAYKEVRLVTDELNNIPKIDLGNVGIDKLVGSVRSQLGDATSDAYTFVRTFKNIIDETISHRLVKIGDDIVPKDFSEIRIDYKKLEDEIIKSDNKILELSHQIANATEEESVPLRENLRILDNELDMYEEILKYMVSDDYYKYDESSLNSFIQRREENKTLVGNKYKSKDIAEENKNLEKQNLLNKQIETQMSNLLVLRAKLQKQGLSTDGIDKLFDSLSNVDDRNAFSMWLEDVKQFKNEIKLLIPGLDEWEERLKKINAQQDKTLEKDFKENIANISNLNPSGVNWKKEYTNGKGEWIGALAEGTTSYDSLLDKYHELIVARKELNKFEELAAKNPEVYAERLQEAKDVLSAILGDIKTIETDTYLDSLTDEQLVNLANIKTKFEDIVRLSEAANNNVAEKQAQDSQKIWDRINKANEQALNKALSSFNQFGNKEFQKSFIPELQSEIDALKIEFQRLIDIGSNGEIIPKAEIDAAVKSLQRLSKEVIDTNKYYAESKDVTNLYSKIAGFMDNNTAMARNFKRELQGILDVLKSGGSITQEEFTELESHFNKVSGQVKELHQTGNSLFASFKKQLKSANAQFLTTYFSLQDFIRYGREAFNTIKELDYALVDLKKTTTMSSSELDEFYSGASETARQMGVTTKEIIDQAAAWSRLGYSSKDAATEMAALSSQFAQISPGMSVDLATDGLVSTMKAFHVDVADVERNIMDVINKTGNTMATTNEEIVEMLKRSSAAMSAANNTIEETIALESAAVQITRNAETTGTAFRTISMRIRGYDEETEEYIGGIEELTGKIADLTKTAKTPGGLSLFTDETKSTYKSTFQILKEISDIYKDLSDKNQAELLETLAGKRGGQVLAGILEDFSEVERAMKNMSEAAGSADAEMSIVEESIQYKLNNLQQTWVGIIQELIDRGILGDLIDALTAISEVLGEIITTVGPIPTILGAIGLTKLIPNLDNVFNVIQKISGEGLGIIDVVEDAPNVIGDIGEAVEEVTGTIETAQGVAEGIPGTITSIQGALTALMANPLTPWIIGITVAVGAVALAIDHSTVTVKEATKALKDYSDKYSKMESDLETHEKAVENLSDSYFKLAQGVDSITGKNVSLSTEDYEEFVATNQELAEMFPQLIKGVDEYGNYILDLGKNADESREKLKELLEQEKENYNYEMYRDLPDVFEKTKIKIDDAATSLHNAEDDLAEYNRILEQIDSASVFNDNPFVLSTKFTNENTAELIRQFELNYQNMIDEIAKENEDLAFRLRDALQDDSDGENFARYLNFAQFSDEDRKLIDEYFDEYVVTATKGYTKGARTLNRDLQTYQSQMSSAWTGLKKSIIGGIDFLSEDDKVTESLTQFVNALPAEVAEELKDVDIQSLIANWVNGFEGLKGEDKLRFNDLFDPELTPQERINLYNELSKNLPEDLQVYVKYVVDKDQDLINRVNASKAKYSNGMPGEASVVDKFFEDMQIDTEEEYDLWLEVTKGIDDAYKAMEAYRKAKEAAVAVKEDAQFDVAKFNENDSDLESLQTLYNQFRENVEGDKIKVPLDISDIESLPDTWKGLDGFKDFELKVTTSTDISEVQKAFDDIVTEYSRSMIKIKGATKETMEMVKAQLKMDGLEETGVDKLVDSLVAEDKMNQLVSSLEAAQDAEGRLSDGAIAATGAMFKEAQQIGLTDDVLKDYLAQALKAGNIKIDGDLSWLQQLADALKIDIGLLQQLLGLASQGSGLVADKNGSKHSIYLPAGAPSDWGAQQQEWRNNQKHREESLKITPTEKSTSGGAGKEAADAYVEAYQKELEQLQKDRDRGLISEKVYLEKLKALIDRFFKDRAEYVQKYCDEMKNYMDALLSHYNSVISGVTTLIGRRITALQKEKDAVISALQEEQAAVEAEYQAEIDAIQSEIDAIQEKIDALEDEIEAIDEKIEKLDEENEKLEEQIEVIEDQSKAIDKQRESIEELIEALDEEIETLDEKIKKQQKEQENYNKQIQAINDANAARERSISLQKAEYDLQRMQNQRTKLVCKYARGYSNVA